MGGAAVDDAETNKIMSVMLSNVLYLLFYVPDGGMNLQYWILSSCRMNDDLRTHSQTSSQVLLSLTAAKYPCAFLQPVNVSYSLDPLLLLILRQPPKRR